ncbi:YopX family protein [Enterococcus faecium]|nr:YopX family protein [Enterococcus faecium]
MIPKFRAWDREKDRMIYPSTTGVCFEMNDDGISVLDIDVDYPNDYGFPKIASILMQSTTLKDKNGVDVYQGDIIRCTRGCHHEVIWLEEYGGTFFGGMPAWYLSGLSNGYAWTGREEVIGNIYENSELLEEQR